LLLNKYMRGNQYSPILKISSSIRLEYHRTMELRHIRNFLVLAEELHFGRAAYRLSMTQPPLSIAIKQLEEELGVSLLLRTSKSVALTSAGVTFYAHAQKLLAQLEAACTVTKEVGQGGRGRLNVGFVGGMLLRGVPHIVSEYDRLQTGVTIGLKELGSADQVSALLRGQLSAGFLHATAVPPELDAVVIRSEPFVACLPESHPLSKRPTLDVRELQNEDMVLFSRVASPGYYDSVIALCVASGFSPVVRHEVMNWFTAVMLVSRGGGVAIVPAAFSATEMRGVRFVPLALTTTQSIAYFAWKRDDSDAAQRAFIDFVCKRFKAK
jgi:DNA-binding transcriptional LysR family regulator